MTFKQYIVKQLQEKKRIKKILFIDGQDTRAIQAAILHKEDALIEPVILLETHNAEVENKVSTIVIEDWKDRKDELIEKYLEKRKGKDTRESAEKVIFDKNYFAMLMVEMGEVDGTIGGLVAPTADILRPAFKVIGPKEGVKTISSVMVMERADEWYIFTDISVNIEPNEQQLLDIAVNASEFASLINFKTKVAFLSFSTSGSAVHPASQKVRSVTEKFNETFKPEYKAIGEVQFDAAFSPDVRESKYKEDGFKKSPTIFVFPDLNAGNIGYKIAQRMGGFGAVGPIITGLKKPVNDLSRGAETIDVYNTALLTAIQCID